MIAKQYYYNNILIFQQTQYINKNSVINFRSLQPIKTSLSSKITIRISFY